MYVSRPPSDIFMFKDREQKSKIKIDDERKMFAPAMSFLRLFSCFCHFLFARLLFVRHFSFCSCLPACLLLMQARHVRLFVFRSGLMYKRCRHYSWRWCSSQAFFSSFFLLSCRHCRHFLSHIPLSFLPSFLASMHVHAVFAWKDVHFIYIPHYNTHTIHRYRRCKNKTLLLLLYYMSFSYMFI